MPLALFAQTVYGLLLFYLFFHPECLWFVDSRQTDYRRGLLPNFGTGTQSDALGSIVCADCNRDLEKKKDETKEQARQCGWSESFLLFFLSTVVIVVSINFRGADIAWGGRMFGYPGCIVLRNDEQQFGCFLANDRVLSPNHISKSFCTGEYARKWFFFLSVRDGHKGAVLDWLFLLY